MLLAVAAACSSETIEVPGETVVVEKIVTETVEVPGETVVVEKEVIKTVEVPGETVTKEVVKEVMVPGETVVVEKEVVKTVEVPGQTVVKEVVKTVEVPGQTVVVEKEVVKTVEVPGQTVVVEKVVVKEVPAGYVTDPSNGRVYVAPQYGGSITTLGGGSAHGDTWKGSGFRGIPSLLLDKLGIADWATPRDVFDFREWSVPLSIVRGQLAESYEISPDGLTFTFNIRKGVNWHDKAPMNGRELVAEDIVQSFHRFAGLGDFAEAGASPFNSNISKLSFESITAPDKYTVVFKLSSPSFDAFEDIYSESQEAGFIYPPEVIQEHGDAQDWRTLVGTGPYMLTSKVVDSSETWEKNPNYWDYDEKFPQNRLPYIDEIKGIHIAEVTTQLAALRTGKIDRLQIQTLDQKNAIEKTNPELEYSTMMILPWTFAMEVRKPPFDDVRVRTAMQLALDLDTMNNMLLGGLGDTTPHGIFGTGDPAYSTPFEEWPQEIKDNYDYDPERAEALLDAAGYERGADGIRFSTKLNYNSGTEYWNNLDYTQIAVDMWSKIGVDVEIDIMESAVIRALINAHTYEGMVYGMRGVDWPPLGAIRTMAYTDFMWNMAGVQDPVYDGIVEAAETAGSAAEMLELVKEADMYFAEKQWVTWGPTRPNFYFWQPWMVGYNGELTLGGGRLTTYLSRVWLDSDLRYEMTGTR